MLARLKVAAVDTNGASFVFATGTGRPLQQRNVARALREAQKRAVDGDGQADIPDPPRGGRGGGTGPGASWRDPIDAFVSSYVASRALLAGESVDEVAFLLDHRDGTVTRTVYLREVADARRRSMRRSRMAAEFAGALRVAPEDEAD